MKRQAVVPSNAMGSTWRGMLLAILVLVASHVATTAQTRSLPARLETYLTNAVRLTGDERQRLLNGDPVTKLLDADESKEVAIFGAVWVNAPMRRYVEAVSNIEAFERGGGFKVTKRVSAPPRLEDFATCVFPTRIWMISGVAV